MRKIQASSQRGGNMAGDTACATEMTRSRRTSFEVQILRSGQAKSWQLVESFDHETTAKKSAQQMLKRSHCLAVRVVRDWLRADGTHSETIVMEEMAARSLAPDISVSHVADAPLCHDFSELYELPSRITIGRLLRKYLEHHVITPTELLYSYRQLKRFGETDNLLMSAIDLAARAQAAKTEGEPAERHDFLYRGWDKIYARARNAAKRKNPAFLEGSFAAIVAEAERRLSQRNDTIHALMVRQLAYERTWLGKLGILMTWLLEAKGHTRSWILDGFIADLFLSKGFIEDLLGQQNSLGGALMTLLLLADGKAKPPRAAPDGFAALNRFFGEGLLPEARRAIIFRVQRELFSSQPLNRLVPEGELQEFKHLARALVTPNQIKGGTETAEALTDRYCRIINISTLRGAARAIQGITSLLPDGCRRLQYLVTMLKLPWSAELAQKAIADYLGTLHSASPLFPISLPVVARMSAMTSLHQAILDSQIPTDMRSKLGQRLDQLQRDFLVQSGVIKQIDDVTSPLAIRATRLVGFCRPGVLIDGASVRLARVRVIEELKQPNFDALFVAGLPDKTQANAALSDFYRLLVQCGF